MPTSLPHDPDPDPGRTLVGAVMDRAVTAVQDTCRLSIAVDVFVRTGLAHLVVVDADGLAVGLVSHERLSAAWFDPPHRRPPTVGDLLDTRSVPVLTPRDTARAAARAMAAADADVLPVVDDEGMLVGMLTSRELLALLGREPSQPGSGPGPADRPTD